MNRGRDLPLGQLIILGFDGTAVSPALRAMLTRIQPAGVILFARNIVDAQQTHKLLADCQACVQNKLFTCVDMEGGTVDRFRNALGNTPSAAEIFATRDKRLFRKHGKVIGESCRALGFNVDFAPVVDLAFEASRKVMSSRAVSDDPAKVAAYAKEFLAGLKARGVTGSLKHFPGLGEANLDTHHELPSVTKAWKKLWSQDLAPYRSLRRVAPMVMVSHAAYPAVTRERTPASLSKKWVTEILKKRIGYRGLIVSDDLEMGGVLKAAPIEQAAIGHIRAGGDLCLICHIEEHVEKSYDALVAEAARNAKFAARCQESIRRVLAFKKSHLNPVIRTAPMPAKVERLQRRLWEFGEQVRLEGIKQQTTLRAYA